VAQLRQAGTLVSGRLTYELIAAFWPTPAGGQSGPGVAKAMNTTPEIVISRTLAQATWPGTQIISNHAEEELAKLKQQPGKDIAILGSSTLTAGLMPAALAGEVRIIGEPGHPRARADHCSQERARPASSCRRPGSSPPATSCSTTSRSHADQHRTRRSTAWLHVILDESASVDP
jgi:hypothetical protein